MTTIDGKEIEVSPRVMRTLYAILLIEIVCMMLYIGW